MHWNWLSKLLLASRNQIYQQNRKRLERNTHSSTSTQISSGFPSCPQYGSEVAGLMGLMLYLYGPYYSFCVTGKLLTINWVWNGSCLFISKRAFTSVRASLHVLSLFHAEIFSIIALLPLTFAWDYINSIWWILQITERVALAVMLWTGFREVIGSNIGCNTCYLDRSLWWFSSLQTNAGMMSRLDHDSYLPNPFQFIIVSS